jgi:glycosyltransferase involved in cell wall biosynthesis
MYSLCLTNYERFDLLIESFKEVIDDPRITEIVISDDCSSETIYQSLVQYSLGHPKIKLFRNDQNVGMSLNKKLAIERATSEWCILFDSDNRLTKQYINALYRTNCYPNVINMPESGGEGLDYTRFSKWWISRYNVKHFLSFPTAAMTLNTCNYFVNRERYLAVYEHNPEVIAADTIWFNYLWLKSGGAFIVVPGLRYFHRVHKGSGFMQDLDSNTKKCDEILNLIKSL